MKRFYTLEYWEDDGWYVGRLCEVPDVFSQGKTIEELKENIIDAFHMMYESVKPEHTGAHTIEIGFDL